jgi:hypothetical protein
MMTPDDASNEGQTKAEWFPARRPVLRLCEDLKRNRDIETLKTLPHRTGGAYGVMLHQGGADFRNRVDYFSGFDSDRDQVVFLDPDNGFEPEKSCSDKHVAYGDVTTLLGQLNERSIVSVFHHFRRVSFPDDFARIRSRLEAGIYSTAIYWHSLMFVVVGRSEESIGLVTEANRKYARSNPVRVLS